MGITMEQFNRVAEHLQITLAEAQVVYVSYFATVTSWFNISKFALGW